MLKDRDAEQGDVDGLPGVQPGSGMVAAETRGSIAAQQAAGTLRWIGVNDPVEEQRLQADHAQPTSSLAAQKSSPAPTTRSMRCRKTEAWQTCSTWMTATF